MSNETSGTIAILARDGVAGHALELLLQGVGYRTRLIRESAAGEDDLLRGVVLLLVSPSSDGSRHDSLFQRTGGVPTGLPVLELSSVKGGVGEPPREHVLWPCSMEHLKAEIDAVLAAIPRTGLAR